MERTDSTRPGSPDNLLDDTRPAQLPEGVMGQLYLRLAEHLEDDADGDPLTTTATPTEQHDILRTIVGAGFKDLTPATKSTIAVMFTARGWSRDVLGPALGVRLKAAGGEKSSGPEKKKHEQGEAVTFAAVDPAETPRPLGEILDDLLFHLRRFMHLPDGAAETVATWIAWTYVEDRSYILPILALTSPIKGCGKTTLLDVIEQFVPRPARNTAPTAAALFRFIEAHHPTLLLDEADVWMKGRDDAAATVRAVVNDGHRRGGGVLRCVGDDHEARLFRVDTPKAIAGIGDFMQDATADRAIVVALEKAPPSARLESFRGDRHPAPHLRGQLLRWADDHGEEFGEHDPNMGVLRNREADNWRPLFGVADVAGGRWPEVIRLAAEEVRGRAAERTDTVSPGERLVTDAYTVFEDSGEGWLLTAAFDQALLDLPDSPYQQWRAGQTDHGPSARGGLLGEVRDRHRHEDEAAIERCTSGSAFEVTWAALGISPDRSARTRPTAPRLDPMHGALGASGASVRREGRPGRGACRAAPLGDAGRGWSGARRPGARAGPAVH